MKLSTKGRYGLRAVIDLALASESDRAVSITSIARRQSLSKSYLEQLVRSLRKAGLVASTRGAQGGYRLAKSPAEISVGDILRALEGDLDPVDCAALRASGQCTAQEVCVTKYVWERISDSINAAVDGITLQQLLDESRLHAGGSVRCACEE